jgi:DNA repair exonuclease SbcCD ATPase subunit
MKIISLEAENFKRLSAVSITPDGSVVEITGKNAAGKSSILDAIWSAIKGKSVDPVKPVRAGEERATIKVDLGHLKVTRKFIDKGAEGYSHSLTVETADGARYQKPQEILDGLTNALSFDPLAFCRMKEADQIAALEAAVPDFDFDAARKDERRLLEERRDVKRDRSNKETLLQATPASDTDPGEEIDEDAIIVKINDVNEGNRSIYEDRTKRQAYQNAIDFELSSIKKTNEQIDELKQKISHLEETLSNCRKELERNETLLTEMGPEKEIASTDDLQTELNNARAHNERIRQHIAYQKLLNECLELEKEETELTSAIEAKRKAMADAVLSAASLPDGLTIENQVVMLNGIPLSQASQAEQLRASVAIVAAMNPELRVMQIRDGALLDSDSMALLADFARDNDLQCWVETVSSDRPSAIEIVDGHVAGVTAEAAE